MEGWVGLNRAQGKAKVEWTGWKPQVSNTARGKSELEIPINQTVLVTPLRCRHPPAAVSTWSSSQITVPGCVRAATGWLGGESHFRVSCSLDVIGV